MNNMVFLLDRKCPYGRIQDMQKTRTAITLQLIAAGMMLTGPVLAQQPSTGSTTQSKPSSSAKSTTSSKTGTTHKSTTTAKSTGTTLLRTQKAKASYALGMSIGMGVHKQSIDVDPAIVARGLRDAMAGGKTLMTEDEMRTALQELRADVNKQQEAKAHAAGAANRKEGETFLEANKSKPGVKTLPDGLQYKVLKEGSGPKPTASDTVTVNYRGTLVNGKEFDSSYKRGQPATFPVGGVIKGWTEALLLMPVGSKWELYLPADLAYGDRGAGPDIGPGDTLVFEVELLSIGDKK